MLRSTRRSWILAVLLLAVQCHPLPAQAVTADQLTPAEQAALAEVQAKGDAWAAQRVAALEYILSTKPTVTLPETVKVLQGRDLIVSYDPPYVELVIPPRKEGLPPEIDWKVLLPTNESKSFVPSPGTPWWFWLAVLGAAIGGAALDRALK